MMCRFLLLVFCVLQYLQGSCFALTISFNKEAEITGTHILLADVAEFDEDSLLVKALASKRIAIAPKAGESLSISRNKIQRKITRELEKSNSTEVQLVGSPSTRVTRTGIPVTANDIEAVIDDYLLAKGVDLPMAEYSFSPRELPLPFTIPVGKLEIDVIPSNPEVIGSRRITLIYKVNGKTIKNISIRGTLKAMAPVAILTHNVKRGTILTPNMVQLRIKDLGKLRSPCTDLREVLGKRLTRNLRSGTVLDLSSIDFPPLIRKGQLVKILINHNGLYLSAKGISAMNGKQDQIIRVTNTGSKKTIYCKVLAPGIVEVQI